jgi:16S rRNA (guanine527-N7)-methyltransferase
VGKKINYLEETITKLGLGGIEALNGRAEDLGQQKNYREHYDIVTARAVALLPVLCELALPLVKIGGLFIAQKTVRAEEIASAENAILELGGKIQEIKKYTLPGTEERALIIIKKVSDTPDNFPRVYNLLTKNPL